MSYQISPKHDQSFTVVRQGFLQADGLPFSEILSEQQVQEAFEEEEDALFGEDENAVYTPALTLWTSLSQVLHAGVERSCEAAVDRLRTLCVALSIRVPSSDSGAYCRARSKLSEDVLQRLTYEVADELEEAVPEEWLWYGRHAKIVDGSTLLVPDTDANQAEWPQSTSQKPGLGFPILRMCAILSLATGAMCGFAEGPYKGKQTGEPALLRSLFGRLQAGDVLVGDCCFCSFSMIALLMALDVDVLFCQHQRRVTDFSKGKRLGPKDHTVRWPKPQRPTWMDEATYAELPDEIVVRELAIDVKVPGFRTREVILVTTMTKSNRYSQEALGDLYRQRWHVELDLRAIKVHMNMEDLRCKCPEMVRKEIWTHCLAYNLIRKTMAQAAHVHERTVRSISFSGALQAIAGVMGQASVADEELLGRLVEEKLKSIASRKVGHRPNRVEPRAVKRRPRKQKLLSKPRAEARAELGVPKSAA
jgi:putative transposase